MCSQEYHKDAQMLSYANDLMKYFVKKTCEMYGHDFVSHNVHNLVHLAGDVSLYGKLDNFSAFPFENYMSQLKKMLRKREKPLQQVIKRISEGRFIKKVIPTTSNSAVELFQQHYEGPLLQNFTGISQYKVVRTKKYVLKTREPDCFVQLQNNDIIKIVNFNCFQNGNNSEIKILGYKFLEQSNFFNSPCESSFLGIFDLNCSKMSTLSAWTFSEIKCKLVYMPYSANKSVVYPLLH
ncbi:hypothetical protein NQ314_007650 [Rhamnusium bicolor]|uniref:Uncharacterized protein n=1 Tax=Rhamnusium bicolor TaxID=1586634 RepID=A0AAV8YKJ3_9CUCU|nr:hypothetical protein NQ314_007650 [Rhamnusium bicolor]